VANKGYVTQLLGRLPSEQRRPLLAAFDYLLDNLRLGLRDDKTRAENLQGYRLDGTTHATANTEFSIAHGLGAAPYLLVPILPMETGAQLVPLTVSRAPDAERIYLTSASTGASISVYVEV
jgi:hypothetical protein